MDPMDTLEPDTSLMPDASSLYTPTDLGYDGTQAFAHLQWCISRAAEHALASGTPTDLIRNRLKQHQIQFDAVLYTLNAIFQLGDPQAPQSPPHLSQQPMVFALTGYMRGPKGPPALLDPTLPQQTASTIAVWGGHNEFASLQIGDNFPATPQFTPGNPDWLGNRRRHLEAVAAQRAQIDEVRRAANADMVGGWLESVTPVFDDAMPQHFARSYYDVQDDAEHSSSQTNPNKRRRTSIDQVDDNDAVDAVRVDAVRVEEPTANSVPTRTQSGSNVPPPGEFYSRTAQQGESSGRDLVFRPRHG